MFFITLLQCFVLLLFAIHSLANPGCPIGTERQYFTRMDGEMVKLDFEHLTAIKTPWPSDFLDEKNLYIAEFHLENDITVVTSYDPDLNETESILIHYFSTNESFKIANSKKHFFPLFVSGIFFSLDDSVFLLNSETGKCYEFDKNNGTEFQHVPWMEPQVRHFGTVMAIISGEPCLFGVQRGYSINSSVDTTECLNTTSRIWYFNDNLFVPTEVLDKSIIVDNTLYICGHGDDYCNRYEVDKGGVTAMSTISFPEFSIMSFDLFQSEHTISVMVAGIVTIHDETKAILRNLFDETQVEIPGNFSKEQFFTLCIPQESRIINRKNQPTNAALNRIEIAVTVVGVICTIAVFVMVAKMWHARKHHKGEWSDRTILVNFVQV